MADRPDYESIKLGLKEIATRNQGKESQERFQSVLESWQSELLQDVETGGTRLDSEPNAEEVRGLLNQVNELLGDQ